MAKFNILVLVLCLTFSVSLAQIVNPFFSTPLVNTRLFAFGVPSVIKAAPDQSLVVVGFQNGNVAAYSMSGSFMYQFTGGSSARIKQLAWIPNTGPISLDTSGNVVTWNKNGTRLNSISFNSNVFGMSLTTSAFGTTYAGFVFGNSVVQYGVGPSGFVTPLTYSPPSGYQFAGQIMYSAGYGTLFLTASSITNSSNMLYAYSCGIGSFTNFYSLPGSVQAFAAYVSGSYLMLVNGNVYSFTTNLNPINLVMTTCLGGPYIVTANSFTLFPTITIWNSQMVNQQTLNYPMSNVISIDCSGSYLVSLDSSNYLAIDTYTTSEDIAVLLKLAGWVIGIIVGAIVLIIGGIIACICCCCCRRNKGTQVMMNNSMGQELIITSPSPQYNTNYNQQPYPQNNAHYNTQYNGPTAEVRFQTNNLSNPQQQIYVEAKFDQKY